MIYFTVSMPNFIPSQKINLTTSGRPRLLGQNISANKTVSYQTEEQDRSTQGRRGYVLSE